MTRLDFIAIKILIRKFELDIFFKAMIVIVDIFCEVYRAHLFVEKTIGSDSIRLNLDGRCPEELSSEEKQRDYTADIVVDVLNKSGNETTCFRPPYSKESNKQCQKECDRQASIGTVAI